MRGGGGGCLGSRVGYSDEQEDTCVLRPASLTAELHPHGENSEGERGSGAPPLTVWAALVPTGEGQTWPPPDPPLPVPWHTALAWRVDTRFVPVHVQPRSPPPGPHWSPRAGRVPVCVWSRVCGHVWSRVCARVREKAPRKLGLLVPRQDGR